MSALILRNHSHNNITIVENDFEMIQGTVLFMAILYVTVNLVVDIIYLYINPKVSYESERRAG